jgi:hypothetical protein
MTIYTSKTNQQFFPFAPEYSTWEDWTGNFAIYFGELNIAFSHELEWREAAEIIAGSSTFSAFPIPTPENHETWQEWANAVTLSINGKSH